MRQSQLKKNVGDMSLVSIIFQEETTKVVFRSRNGSNSPCNASVVPATQGTYQQERDTGEQDQKWESSNNGVARILRQVREGRACRSDDLRAKKVDGDVITCAIKVDTCESVFCCSEATNESHFT